MPTRRLRASPLHSNSDVRRGSKLGRRQVLGSLAVTVAKKSSYSLLVVKADAETRALACAASLRLLADVEAVGGNAVRRRCSLSAAAA